MVRPARRVLCGLISLVLPEDCRVCGTPLLTASRVPVCDGCLQQAAKPLEAAYLCSRCRAPFLDSASLNESGVCPVCAVEPEGADSTWSFGPYDGVLRRLIHLYKYDRVDTLAAPLARLLLDALPRDDEEFDLITPMPLHWLKRWGRGFNQSELLAREVSRRTGIAYCDALRRTKGSAAQAGLTVAARRDNVRGVFRLAIPKTGGVKPLSGKHVLLVDDVLTTGATVASASRVLKRNGGARRVSVLTLARADRRFAWRRQAFQEGASAGV